jgi:hypothetical protein
MGKTALSGAERHKRFREKQLSENLEGYKAKCRQKNRVYLASLSEAAHDRLNRRKTVAMRRLRQKRRAEEGSSVGEARSVHSAYKTPAAKAKALTRLCRGLPRSPTKQRDLVRSLATKLDVQGDLEERKKGNSSHGNCVDPKWIAAATEFLLSDSASRATPGRKDCMKVKQADGSIEEKQLRYFHGNMKETFALFKDESPDAEIGCRTFANLRPPWVRFASETPHNACLCVHHENFNYVVAALHSKVRLLPASNLALIQSVVCDPSSEQCMLTGCENCPSVRNSLWYEQAKEYESK